MDKDRKRDELNRAFHEHRALEQALHSLVQHVVSAPEFTAMEFEQLAHDLRSLRASLERHFKREEEGGLFDDIQRQLPMAHSTLETLKQQHPKFLLRVDALIEQVEQSGAEKLAVIRRGLRGFLEAFRTHEDTENELLQRTHCLDVGSPD